jgi:hypothetical protein
MYTYVIYLSRNDTCKYSAFAVRFHSADLNPFLYTVYNSLNIFLETS